MILTYLKESAGRHLFGIAVAVGLLIAGRSYLAEHDARLIAEQTIKTAQVQIDSLQKQSAVITQAGQQKVMVLQKQAEAVKTPAQAIAALPAVSTVDLHPAALPDAPSAVQVDALPLYQELNTCKQDAVNLGVCGANLDIEKQVTAQKDVEITALKKKPGFWHRVRQTAEMVAIGAALGYAAHR